MNEYLEQAKAKLESEAMKGKFDHYGSAMKDSVKSALLEFCQQEPEFAQAVVQGGSLEDCLKAVSKEIKDNSISDLAAYKAAVQFYFPGAGVDMKMTVNLCASVEKSEPAKTNRGLVLDLSAFL